MLQRRGGSGFGRFAVWLLAGSAAVTVSGVALAAPTIWVTHSTQKIRPTGATSTGTASVRLSAAKNEFEAFQLVVQGPADVTGLAVSDLTGPGTISAQSQIRVFREGLINVTTSSASDGWTGWTPDPMVPDVDDVVGEKRNAFPFNVPSGESRVLFVEILVPKTAAAGEYTGTATVQSAQGSATAQITLNVWNFELPSTSSLRSHFALSYGALPTAHGVSGAAFSTLRARYSQLSLDHHISLGNFDDGNSSTSNFETYYGPLITGSAPTRLSGAKQTSVVHIWGTPSAWKTFFDSKGWPNILFQYTCDEPPAFCAWSDIPPRAAAARAAGIPALVTTNIPEATANGVLDDIDIIVPVINHLDDKSGTFFGDQSPKYSAFSAPGDIKELWTYQSCMSHGCGGSATGWASYMIDGASIRSRAQEWLSFYWGATGELYFETTYAYTQGADPWVTQYYYTGNGDGTLFYPGTPAKIGGSTHIPVASLRLKMIREGFEDFEYLKKVADLGDPAFARNVARTLFPHPYQVEPPPADLFAAREQLAQRILELLGLANQPCSDGTAAGQCSATKPMRCNAGTLAPACASCGCPTAGEVCGANGSCTTPLGYVAAGLPGPATIDAQLAEYETLPAMTLTGTANGSATVRAAWDSQALYVAFDVTDDQLYVATGTEGDLWNGDSVEVMLDTALDRSATADLNDFHYLLTPADSLADSRGWADFGFTSGTTRALDLRGAAVPGPSTGYRVELKIPWAAMGVTPSAGMRFGFDVAFNDRDSAGGSTSPKDFAGLSSFNNPQGWAQLTLGAPIAGADAGTPAGPDASAPPGPDASTAPGADAETPAGPDAGTAHLPDAVTPPAARDAATVAADGDAGPRPDPDVGSGACGCSSTGAGLNLAFAAMLLGALRARRVVGHTDKHGRTWTRTDR